MRPAASPPPSAPAAAAPHPPSERRVLDALPLALHTVDLDGRVTGVHGAGAPASERAAVGAAIWDALPDRASREQMERAMQLLRGARVPSVQWERRGDAPDGDGGGERVSLVHVAPLHDALDPHAVSGFVVATVDITPSHRAREALLDGGVALARALDLERVYAEVAQQLRRVVRAEAFCLALAEDATSPPRVVHQLGYDPAGPDDETRDAWREAIATGRAVVRQTPRGPEITVPLAVPVASAPVDGAGVLGAMSVRADDAGHPERLDEATRALEALAAQTAAAVERARRVRRVERTRRLEAIGEVAAGVARELRHPLFGIASAAQLLRYRVQDDPVVEKNVGRVLREVERLNRLVTSLLEYGRPAAPRLEPGDPDAVWDEVLDAQRGLLEGKALLLDRARPPTAARVRLDAERLAQLFLNVLANAADAAPEASDLTLTSTTLPDGGWRCRLHNGGPAIPADVLPRVFEIFQSTKPGAAGVGLALCERIADEHGGTIAIASTPGSGTAVTITLPPA